MFNTVQQNKSCKISFAKILKSWINIFEYDNIFNRYMAVEKKTIRLLLILKGSFFHFTYPKQKIWSGINMRMIHDAWGMGGSHTVSFPKFISDRNFTSN